MFKLKTVRKEMLTRDLKGIIDLRITTTIGA